MALQEDGMTPVARPPHNPESPWILYGSSMGKGPWNARPEATPLDGVPAPTKGYGWAAGRYAAEAAADRSLLVKPRM